ncbi:hypothetical protein ABH994_001691 [Bradyrhizobium yuanmingense]|uniref:hypothetical protein n=1 Tax=Bradyrhizobium yuanmingense TaxID=108015 RepID=UPI0035198D49
MRLRLVVALMASLAASPAAAEWRISSSKDRLTDKESKVATLEAKAPDHNVSARLVVRCLADKLVGGLTLSIETSARFYPGRMGLRYRVDGREPVPRYMPVDATGSGMSLWADTDELRGARRIRVELEPYRAPNLFFDFDLTGVDKAFASIPCNRTKPKWEP